MIKMNITDIVFFKKACYYAYDSNYKVDHRPILF